MTNRLWIRMALLTFSLVMVLALAGCGGSQPNPDLSLGGIDVGEVFSGIMARVPKALSGVTSMESADRANDELVLVSSDLDDLIFNSQKLSEKGQLDLAMLALKATPEIKQLARMVNDSPALKDKLGGSMADILLKMKELL